MSLWFTSDLHLGHVRINELAGRPFSSVEEGDAELIRRWNERVGTDDDVMILGDLCMGRITESLALVPLLNGRKHLVPGNHDRVWHGYHGSGGKKVEWRNMYREVLTEWAETITEFVLYEDIVVDICHFPYEGDHVGEERYPEARPKDEGRWLLHGHVHEEWKVRGRMVNVGVDVWDYAPVSVEELVEVIRSSS